MHILSKVHPPFVYIHSRHSVVLWETSVPGKYAFVRIAVFQEHNRMSVMDSV